jgi:hypothetical protein
MTPIGGSTSPARLRTLASSVAVRTACALAMCSWVAGCMTEPAAADGVSAVQFQDVVVPTGLRLVDAAHRSYAREEAGWRHARYEYIGSADVLAAADYVRERMPQHSWSKVQDAMAGDTELRLRFERGIYRADYTFTRSEGATVMIVDYTTDYTRR